MLEEYDIDKLNPRSNPYAKEFRLIYNAATDRYELGSDELHCGDVLQVLIRDATTSEDRWQQTRIEYNEGWYLVGLADLQIDGLTARK